jgi:choice-of-anchor B domain-containing protein
VRRSSRAAAAGLAALALCPPASGQVFDFENAVLLAHRDEFEGYNDVWGFVGNDGREYVIQGLTTGTAWWDVDDPTSPVLVKMIPGPTSGWRDMFVIGDHCYVGTEGGGGIQIVDISDPGNPVLVDVYDATISNSHNVFGDPSRGLLFACGGNSNGANGGIQILDVSDPVHLVEIGRWTDQYVHDLSVEGNLLHACLVYNARLRLIDASDPTNPVSYGNAFIDPTGNVHSAWPFGDGVHLAIAEEKIGGHVKVLDLSDPDAIVMTDEHNPAPAASAHNVHVQGDLLYVSWYARGTRVLDVSDPYDVQEIGWWDTFPDHDAGGVGPGNWGTYPHLPSGLVASNDRPYGLFLWRYEPDAATLDGTVFSSEGGPLATATAEYLNHGIVQDVSAAGGYKFSAYPGAGHRIRFTAYGFEPDSITVAAIANAATTTDVTLVKLPSGALSGVVRDLSTSLPLEGAEVALVGSPFSVITDAAGAYSFPDVVAGAYGLAARRYGYLAPPAIPVVVAAGQASSRDVEIPPAPVFVDFSAPSGWTVSNVPGSGPPDGSWEFGEPFGTYALGLPIQPEHDHTLDPEDRCALTGNAPVGNPNGDDVDFLTTRLVSPSYDLTGMAAPHVFYYRWYAPGPELAEPFEVEVSSNGGGSWIGLESTSVKEAFWKGMDFDLGAVLSSFGDVRFRFVAQDPDNVQLVEAAVDDFTIYDAQGDPVGVRTPAARAELVLAPAAPNPFRDRTGISFSVPAAGWAELSIFDVRGARVATLVDGALEPGPHRVAWDGRTTGGGTAPSGVYFVKLVTGDAIRTRKVVRSY